MSSVRPPQRDPQGSNEAYKREYGAANVEPPAAANSKLRDHKASAPTDHTTRREGGGIDDVLPTSPPPCNGHGSSPGYFSTSSFLLEHDSNNNTLTSPPGTPYPLNQHHAAAAPALPAPPPTISPHPPPTSWPKHKKVTDGGGIASGAAPAVDGVPPATAGDYSHHHHHQHILNSSGARADLDRGMKIDFYAVQDPKLLASWASFFRDQYILASNDTAAHPNNAPPHSSSPPQQQRYHQSYVHGPPNYYHHHHHSYHNYYYQNPYRHPPAPPLPPPPPPNYQSATTAIGQSATHSTTTTTAPTMMSPGAAAGASSGGHCGYDQQQQDAAAYQRVDYLIQKIKDSQVMKSDDVENTFRRHPFSSDKNFMENCYGAIMNALMMRMSPYDEDARAFNTVHWKEYMSTYHVFQNLVQTSRAQYLGEYSKEITNSAELFFQQSTIQKAKEEHHNKHPPARNKKNKISLERGFVEDVTTEELDVESKKTSFRNALFEIAKDGGDGRNFEDAYQVILEFYGFILSRNKFTTFHTNTVASTNYSDTNRNGGSVKEDSERKQCYGKKWGDNRSTRTGGQLPQHAAKTSKQNPKALNYDDEHNTENKSVSEVFTVEEETFILSVLHSFYCLEKNDDAKDAWFSPDYKNADFSINTSSFAAGKRQQHTISSTSSSGGGAVTLGAASSPAKNGGCTTSTIWSDAKTSKFQKILRRKEILRKKYQVGTYIEQGKNAKSKALPSPKAAAPPPVDLFHDSNYFIGEAVHPNSTKQASPPFCDDTGNTMTMFLEEPYTSGRVKRKSSFIVDEEDHDSNDIPGLTKVDNSKSSIRTRGQKRISENKQPKEGKDHIFDPHTSETHVSSNNRPGTRRSPRRKNQMFG